MEFPGITKELVKSLDPPKQRAIRNHIKEVEELIDKKEDLIKNRDPNEKFLEFKGFAQLEKYEELYRGELGELLEKLEGQTKDLVNSVNEEIRLVKEIRRLAASSEADDTFMEEMNRLKSEIKDEMIIGSLLRQQQHSLDEIHDLLSKISHASSKFPELGEYAGEFDIIRSLFDNVIKDEFPILDLIYNLANIPGSGTQSPSDME